LQNNCYNEDVIRPPSLLSYGGQGGTFNVYNKLKKDIFEMNTIVDGRKVSSNILKKLKIKVSQLGEQNIIPKLAVVLVGDDKPSQAYVKKKREASNEIGIKFSLHHYPGNISTANLIQEIKKIQLKRDLSGLIVQLPLPKNIETEKVLNQINPEIDVDYLTFTNLGKLITGENELVPPTPGAALEILKYYKIKLNNKYVVLIGRGKLIGRPLANLFLHQPVTLSVCNSTTKNLSEFTKKADVIVTGVGKHNLVTGKMIKEGACVIDTGVCFEEGKMYGDIDFKTVSEKASLVTPTPGGIGPITVAKLLENTVINSEIIFNKK